MCVTAGISIPYLIYYGKLRFLHYYGRLLHHWLMRCDTCCMILTLITLICWFNLFSSLGQCTVVCRGGVLLECLSFNPLLIGIASLSPLSNTGWSMVCPIRIPLRRQQSINRRQRQMMLHFLDLHRQHVYWQYEFLFLLCFNLVLYKSIEFCFFSCNCWYNYAIGVSSLPKSTLVWELWSEITRALHRFELIDDI